MPTDNNLCSTANASVNNGSFDPDGEGVTLTQSPAGPYTLGTTNVTLTVVDNSPDHATASCPATVTVQDLQPPNITCPAPTTVLCSSSSGAMVSLNPTFSDNCPAVTASCAPTSGSTFGFGTTPVTCMATDASGNKNSCPTSVTVQDVPPTIASVVAFPNVLTPPNKKLDPVTITVKDTDPCDPAPVCSITGVTATVPISPSNYQITGPLTLKLQANGKVTLALNGDFLGVTDGSNGTIYSVNSGDHYNFCSLSNCADGADATGALVEDNNGDFYGVTRVGGASGAGTVFQFHLVSHSQFGALTTLYSFCSLPNCDDGALPYGGLVRAAGGSFYGTTYDGGSHSLGTVFRVLSSGAFSTVYSFCSLPNCADGGEPWATLTEGTDGNLYGTTSFGGANGFTTYGTVFKITPAGELTTIYSFCSRTACADGSTPYAGVIQGTDGNFYGTTYYGGRRSAENPNGYGTVFRLTPAGQFNLLHAFCAQTGCPDGYAPKGGLVEATDGNFYGVTSTGGNSGDGTVFQISMGLRPFIKPEFRS